MGIASLFNLTSHCTELQLERNFYLNFVLQITHTKQQNVSSTIRKRIWVDQAHEGLRRPRRNHRNEGGLPSTMHQDVVEILEGPQPPRPRKQAILLPRQKDGQDLWTRKDSCIWNGQVFGCPLDSNLNFCQRLRTSTRIFTGQRHINHQKLQIVKITGKFRNSNWKYFEAMYYQSLVLSNLLPSFHIIISLQGITFGYVTK